MKYRLAIILILVVTAAYAAGISGGGGTAAWNVFSEAVSASMSASSYGAIQ